MAGLDQRLFRVFLVGCALVYVLAGLFFTLLPEADLLASRIFHESDNRFTGNGVEWVQAARRAVVYFYWGCVAASLLGLAASAARDTWLHLSSLRWLYLLVCLCVGPGLIANVMLKDQWGRARPRDVIEFGGQKLFTAALTPADQCNRNCSFVSGEASIAFVPFYALAFVLPHWGGVLFAAGTVAGLSAGAIRVSQGAHFASDVVFAGIFMALTATLVHHAMFAPIWLRAVGGLAPRLQRRLG